MDQILKFMPLLLSLLSRGGEVSVIISLITEAFARVQNLLPTPTGPDVSTMVGIQEALEKLGFYTSAVDGVLGDATKAAVKAFQTQHPPLAVDGWPGTKTQAALALAIGRGS